VKAVDWADDRPVSAMLVLAVVTFVALRVWSFLHAGPLLLARAEPDARLALYGQLAASAVAILGISLTVLAILLALPDRPAITDIRDSDTWPRLKGLLMAVASLSLVTLVSAQAGAAVDNGRSGREAIEQIALASALATVVAMVVAGVTFWLLLRNADEPDDPSRGRGQGRYPV
jgi:hypothetical protein